jgi:hypothetical protein
MPVSRGLGITIPAGASYFRITSLAFRTVNTRHYTKVVNGEGAVQSRHGARYNHPGVRSVYLTENPITCFSEKMFYFHREVLTGLDSQHLVRIPVIPPFLQRFVLWHVILKKSIANIFDLSITNASAAGVFPCLLLNPSQDYAHLKDRRAAIQHAGYLGLRAPSTRVTGIGNMVVLFGDQSKNVRAIDPYEVEFRLITQGPPSAQFANHATDLLDYLAGEVRVLIPASAALPAVLTPFSAWTRVPFNH